MADNSEPNFLPAFWRTLKLVEKSKYNSISMAIRNAVAVAIPLAVGIASGNPLGGVAVASGALNVAYSDGRDPYAQRARRMLTWSFLGAFAAFLGSITGKYQVAAILIAVAWAFVAGLLVSISVRAGDLGLNSFVTLIVYAARGVLSPKGALYAGLLVLAGGLLQTALALLFWPLRRYEPERRAIGKVYADLAKELSLRSELTLSTPLKAVPADVQDALSALSRDHSPESERFRLLFDQADRVRYSTYHLSQLQAELQGANRTDAKGNALQIDRLLTLSSKLLAGVAQSLISGEESAGQPALLEEMRQINSRIQEQRGEASFEVSGIALAMDLVAGQLRLVVQLAAHTTDAGAQEFARHELAPPWQLRMTSWLATLKANLNRHTPAFRHAVRLALCIAVADSVARGINSQRNYWLPMTVAVVLKPDFTTTFSRGVLRLCGTFAGLLLATLLYHLLPESALTQLLLVGVFMFFMRYLGPANYGIFSVSISGLIVFLIAATGVSPGEVVLQRSMNTVAGGLFALLAYALWPTWERTHVSETMAEMIDKSRDYFHAVMQRFTSDDESVEDALENSRAAWRRVRSVAEASVDRVGSEPRITARKLTCLSSMLASSYALVHAVMGLEAGVIEKPPGTLPPAFVAFAHDVEFTLYYLSAALRGSAAATKTLPQLREDYRALVDARDRFSTVEEYVLLEADRLTVSLNTLREQVIFCLQ